MRQELRGERTGTRYAIGTRVRIQVSRVDLDGRKIDFRLVQNGQALTSKVLLDKGADTERSPRKRSGREQEPSRGKAGKSASTKAAATEKKTVAKSKAPRKRR
jgi:ribonuclease R